MYCSICLYFDIICRYSGEEASSQLTMWVAPCALTKWHSQRLCSSSKCLSTDLRFCSFAMPLSAFSRSVIFFGGCDLSPSKSARFARSNFGSISVITSLRMRLSTLSTKPRYSLSVVMNRVSGAPSSAAAPSPYRTMMPSAARLTMTFTNSASFLMYCSNLPFLMRYSGG